MKRFIFGEWTQGTMPLTVEEANTICDLADERRREIARYPQDKIYSLLDKLKEKWADESYAPRQKLLQELPSVTGFSSEMIQLAMSELTSVLSSELLKKKLKTENRGVSRRQWTYCDENNTMMRWEPAGIFLHVLSGNVFLVGIGSFLEGLVTGNVNILKMSSGEKVFLPHFLESLVECDTDGVVSRSVAVIDYSSSQTDVMETFKKRVDGIVVWGGEEAVRAYRNDLPARTKVIVYGPKLSVAMVTNDGLREWGPEKVAEKLAFEMAVWDQNACTAPQLCFVEGRDALAALMNAMPESCRKWEHELPPGAAEMNQAVEIQKLRSVAEIAEARGEERLVTSSKNVHWTAYTSRDKTIDPSPLHRTLKLVAYDDMEEVVNEFEKMRGYVQTIGVACGITETLSLSSQLLSAGALRVLELGQMSGGEIDDPHDGSYDLSLFGNYVYARLPSPSPAHHPMDCIAKEDRLEIINERLRELVGVARHSLFYGKRFQGKQVETVADLVTLPVLTREEMESNMLPRSQALSTGDWSGGYVTRSGGSTGEPKYSIYDKQDWEMLVSEAVRALKAAGMAPGDRVANCMIAGDMYGSFVSFDHINARLGATTFAFAGHVSPENFLEVWRKFNLNVLQAMPTIIMPLVKVCKQLDKNFKLEKIIFAGTPMSGTDREWLKSNIGVKSICSVIGANDGGQIAFQCTHLMGAYHHVIDDYNYLEILDEKNAPVADGTAGKIVITSLLKKAFPLIRYEIGDAARVVPKACSCGRTNRVIEYLGRSDDAICVGLMNLQYRDVIKSLKQLPISVIQLAAQNSMEGEWLTLRVECENHTEDFREEIKRLVLADQPLFEVRIQEGQMLRFEIVLFRPGEIPRNPRTGKVKLVVDERI